MPSEILKAPNEHVSLVFGFEKKVKKLSLKSETLQGNGTVVYSVFWIQLTTDGGNCFYCWENTRRLTFLQEDFVDFIFLLSQVFEVIERISVSQIGLIPKFFHFFGLNFVKI